MSPTTTFAAHINQSNGERSDSTLAHQVLFFFFSFLFKKKGLTSAFNCLFVIVYLILKNTYLDAFAKLMSISKTPFHIS